MAKPEVDKIEFFEEGPPPRATRASSIATFEELGEITNVLRTKPGVWARIEVHPDPGTGNKAHKRRQTFNRLMQQYDITGYELIVRRGCELWGRKTP